MIPLIPVIKSFDNKHPASTALLQGVHCLWRHVIVERLFRKIAKKDYSLGNFIGNLDAMIYILLITITSLVEVLYPIVTGLSLYSST